MPEPGGWRPAYGEDEHLDRSSEPATLFETGRTHLYTDVP